MATSIFIPVEEYLRTSYRPDREYVDGAVVERHVGEYFHSHLQILLGALLIARQRDRSGVLRFRVFTELRVEVRRARRYRIPDLCVKAWPHPTTPVLSAPDLAIEILSPEDEPGETLIRVSDYLGSGTPEVWIVDPYKRKLVAADHTGVREIPELVVTNEPVGEVDFRKLFELLDAPVE